MARKRHLLSYLGGVLDSEGAIGIRKGRSKASKQQPFPNPCYSPYVQVAMTVELIPRLFQNTFGGLLRKRKGLFGNKDLLEWTLNGRNCLPFFEEIMPYVLLKRPQIEVGIHLIKNLRPIGGHQNLLSDEELAIREASFILAKKLNH